MWKIPRFFHIKCFNSPHSSKIMDVLLWHWNKSPIILLEAAKRAKTEKSYVKFGQMWRFYSLFSSIAMAWCNMNSCYKVVRPIRNATLKLRADCAKQFVRISHRIVWKTNHGFCIMITHQLVLEFLAKNETTVMPQSHAPADFFLFPKLKTPMKGKPVATNEKIKENRSRSFWR